MERTVDTILDSLKSLVEEKRPVTPSQFVDAAQYLTILMGDEHQKLIELEHQVALLKADAVMAGDTVAKAKTLVEANPLHREMRMQKAKVKQVEEMIRVSKLRARLADSEMRLQ